jgi:hypothetical protein
MSINLPLPLTSTHRGKLFLLTAALAFMTVIGWSQEYTVTNLGTLGGATSQAYAINNFGHVTGLSLNSKGIWFPFLYSNGTTNAIATDIYTVLGPSAAFFPYQFTPFFPSAYGPVAIDDNDHVALNSKRQDDDGPNAFLWINGQSEFMGGGNVFDTPYVNAMNANDVGVGLPDPMEVDFTIPVIYYGTTSEANIPMGSYSGLNAIAINSSEQIAATCIPTNDPDNWGGPACLVTGNSIQLLEVLSGSTVGLPNAIDSAGNICGLSTGGSLGTSTTATYWWGLTPVNLGTPKNTYSSQCLGMDDFGVSVGFAQTNPNSTVATLFDPLNGAQDLNELVPHSRHQPGFIVQNAVAISNTGYIAANCVYKIVEQHACLLTPNLVLILKNSILRLAKRDLHCSQCRTRLVPKADSLPNTLVGLSGEQQGEVVATVNAIANDLPGLFNANEISGEQAKLLIHESEMVLAALTPQ